jgi:hypothetical protein
VVAGLRFTGRGAWHRQHMDDDLHLPTSAVVAATDRQTWTDPDHVVRDGIDARFVVTTWAASFAATLLVVGIAALVIAVAAPGTLGSESSTGLGVLGIVAGIATFLAFATVVSWRLEHFHGDRLVNGLAVSALHLAIAGGAFLVELVARLVLSFDWAATAAADVAASIGDLAALLQLTAATSIVGCLLAIGIVPARGERPSGTQHAAPEDQTL